MQTQIAKEVLYYFIINIYTKNQYIKQYMYTYVLHIYVVKYM